MSLDINMTILIGIIKIIDVFEDVPCFTLKILKKEEIKVNVREIELPGIGRKFEIITRSNEKIVIVVHDDGRREMYHFDEHDHDESISSVTFNDSEARQISAIIGGIVYKPRALETVEMAFNDLVIEWFKVENNATAINKSIGEIDIRNKYGVTVIAIIKKNLKKILNPGSQAVIESGDTVVICGERSELKAVIKELLSSREESL